MLPSDYVGPPAAAVTGNVTLEGVSSAREAERPRLSLEWLSEQGLTPAGGSPLVGQPLRFARSTKIQNDWDIGLETPIERAKLVVPGSQGGARVRVAVGKMVYYDDRDADGRLDWSCQPGSGLGQIASAAACDQVKAVSREFVAFIFVEGAGTACGPLGARAESTTRQRLGPGYHYFRIQQSLAGQLLYELGPDESMSFSLGDRTLGESNPSEELRAFALMLLRLFSSGSLQPC